MSKDINKNFVDWNFCRGYEFYSYSLRQVLFQLVQQVLCGELQDIPRSETD